MNSRSPTRPGATVAVTSLQVLDQRDNQAVLQGSDLGSDHVEGGALGLSFPPSRPLDRAFDRELWSQ